MFINEFIIRMLNPLVIVDFRFICIPACIMSSEFTLEREQWNFYLLRFLEFDVNVFKAILSIQRFFNLTEYRAVSSKKSLLIIRMWKKADLKYWGQFNKTFTSVIFKCSYCFRICKSFIKLTPGCGNDSTYRTTNSFFKQIDSLINGIDKG